MSTGTLNSMADQFAGVATQREFGYALRDFVDQFQAKPDPSLMEVEPVLLEPRLHDSGVGDAYLASAAAWLCHRHGFAASGVGAKSKPGAGVAVFCGQDVEVAGHSPSREPERISLPEPFRFSQRLASRLTD